MSFKTALIISTSKYNEMKRAIAERKRHAEEKDDHRLRQQQQQSQLKDSNKEQSMEEFSKVANPSLSDHEDSHFDYDKNPPHLGDYLYTLPASKRTLASKWAKDAHNSNKIAVNGDGHIVSSTGKNLGHATPLIHSLFTSPSKFKRKTEQFRSQLGATTAELQRKKKKKKKKIYE